MYKKFNDWLKDVRHQVGKELTAESLKYIKSSFYSLVYEHVYPQKVR